MKRILVTVLLMLVGTAHAELRKLTEADFGTNTTKFRSNLIEGANASSTWSRYGISLSSDPSGAPVVRAWRPPCVICVSPYNPVVTNVTKGDQAESVLIVDFRSPVKKVALYLIGANPPLEASIKAVDPAGNKIGALKETVGDAGAFIGFEPSDHRLISKVVLDYGSDQTPEQILDLGFEPASPPRFETVLPQVAHGELGSDSLLKTTISIVNISNTTARGEIRFYSPDGETLAPELEGLANPSEVIQFSLEPAQARLVSTRGKTGISGYARVTSNAPLQAIAHFKVMTSNGEWTETAANSVDGRFRAVGGYDRQLPASDTTGSVPAQNAPTSSKTVGTALAVVNLAKDAAYVRLRQLDEEGHAQDRAFSLEPGEQFAGFIEEIFGDKSARGTIRIWSDRPMASILIKTVNGLPVSILPLGSLED